MPVLHVRALPQKTPNTVAPALRQTCGAIAKAYGCPIEHVWATWEEIKPGFYVEGECDADTQKDQTHPPIAQLSCLEGKPPAVIEDVLKAAAKALGEGLGIPGNVFVEYREMKSGQVLSGGEIVKRE
jgi:hypothetical protein